ncbi:hypothetical protein LTR53_017600 [Teratosphaeriaceae sp. CCFEE 6253]|nr:hypothetical protein LTR53_017600 [Teratosphaeriaceae sp. CCFEE 6253]
MSSANEARKRRDADLTQKMQDAISTLAKPNRSLAVKDVADSTDLNFAKATARRRPVVIKAKSTTHVVATPKHVRNGKRTGLPTEVRTRPIEISRVPSSSARILARLPPAYPTSELPQSSACHVPQTGPQARHAGSPRRAANVEDTPSRGSTKHMPLNLTHAPGTLESPVAGRRAQILQTPIKPVRSLSLVPPAANALVEASPNLVNRTTEPLADLSNYNGGGAVYDALGWDDDAYEPLA